ncbi:MAG: hypothetical protein KC609_16700 [Myxococcales bacterium]|nr:hypothetical protein [Myxococcales bacterium]
MDRTIRWRWAIALLLFTWGCGAPQKVTLEQAADVASGGDVTLTEDPFVESDGIQTTEMADTADTTESADTTETADNQCPPGFSGADCRFCTFATAGTMCHPMSVRDVFDIASIQALSLAQLRWSVTGTQRYNGVDVLTGRFFGGIFEAYDIDGNPKEIDLDYVAALYIPDGWPQPGDPTFALVAGVHYETNLLQPVAAQIAKHFRIPVLYHGELIRDWKELGFDSRGDLNQAGPPSVIKHNVCEPQDVVRGMFALAMARADMHAITLIQRLAEKAGGQIDKVAYRGFSKEGHAAWIVAVVDPRVEVVGPGGYQDQDVLKSAQVRMGSWGCYGDPAISDPNGPQSSAVYLDWLLNTPAGAAYQNLYSVQTNKALLYPRFILMDGDVTASTMHDHLYALGSDTEFLDNLVEVPWRYVRKPGVTSGATDDDGDVIAKAVVPFLLVENLIAGPGSEDALYPKVKSANATIENDALTVVANASKATASMALYWSWSNDRIWNDVDQAKWKEVHLKKTGEGTWTSEPIPLPPGKVIGWYVEARNSVTLGQSEMTRTDAGAVHFLRETPAITCQSELPNWCGTHQP